MFRPLLNRFDIDRTLLFSLAARVWQAISGPVTIALIIHGLTLGEQGIYYGLVSIVGIQTFFELGLLNVLISHAGHESSLINSAANAGDESEAAIASAKTRMSQLIHGSTRWFQAAAILFAIVAIPFGYFTFLSTNVGTDWQRPLLLLIPISGLTLAFSPSLAILEGSGYREEIYRMRLTQLVCGSLAVWVALLIDWGLWSLVIASAVQALMTVYIVSVRFAFFFRPFRSELTQPNIANLPAFSWVREAAPTLWRTAAVTACYHLATQFLTLVVLHYHSTEQAGRLGMTLTITSALQMMAMAWLQTKFAIVSAEHAANRREQAGEMWRRLTMTSTGLLAFGLGAMIGGLWMLSTLYPSLADRFISPWQLTALSIGYLANHLLGAQGFYVLSKRKPPIARASVIGYSLTAAAVWWGGREYAVSGVIGGFAIGMALITLPLHTLAYLVHRRDR